MPSDVVGLIILVGGAFVIIAWGYMGLTWLCRDIGGLLHRPEGVAREEADAQTGHWKTKGLLEVRGDTLEADARYNGNRPCCLGDVFCEFRSHLSDLGDIKMGSDESTSTGRVVARVCPEG